MVLDAMQPMLMTIVKDVLAVDPCSEIVAEGIPVDQLTGVVRSLRPDVVVLGEQGAALAGSDHLVALLHGGAPPVRVVALSDGSRSALLHELRPHVTVIEDLSPQALLRAVTGAPIDDREEAP